MKRRANDQPGFICGTESKARARGRRRDVPGKSARYGCRRDRTVAGFAVRFDKANFAIFEAFNDEAGRAAHLKGAVAAALMANAAELLASPPDIRQPSVLADKLPG